MRSFYSEVDPSIGRHGELHVGRVSVNRVFIPGLDEEILVIVVIPYLSADPEVIIRSSAICTANKCCSIHQHFFSGGGNFIRNYVRICVYLLEFR